MSPVASWSLPPSSADRDLAPARRVAGSTEGGGMSGSAVAEPTELELITAAVEEMNEAARRISVAVSRLNDEAREEEAEKAV